MACLQCFGKSLTLFGLCASDHIRGARVTAEKCGTKTERVFATTRVIRQTINIVAKTTPLGTAKGIIRQLLCRLGPGLSIIFMRFVFVSHTSGLIIL
jgi:hypothetical protein